MNQLLLHLAISAGLAAAPEVRLAIECPDLYRPHGIAIGPADPGPRSERCGQPTRKGEPCKRLVRGGGPCYQHR